MNLKKALVSLVALSLLAVGIAGCGSSGKKAGDNSGKVIKIGATAGPHAQVAEAVAQEAKKQGLNVKVVEFSDYVTPDKALAEGELDLASYQHKPFMENFNKNNNAHLVDIGPTILMRMGIYSDKVKDLKALPAGATVAIPNDPTNGGRALLLLEKAGLLKLKDGVKEKATLQDIAENPKNFKFQEVEAAQVPRTLDDVDAAIINSNFAMQVQLDPTKDSLFIEDSTSPYVNIVAVRQGDENRPEIQALMKVLHSQEIKDFINNKYKGAVVPAF